MSEWQDIESAPKDGKCILVRLATADDWSGTYVAYWSEAWDEWKFHNEGIVRNPAHWMPLPNPPHLDRGTADT